MTAAISTITAKVAILARSKRPYPVPSKAGTVPARNQVLTRPAANSTATLAIAIAEKRRVATRATAVQPAPPFRRASIKSKPSGTRVPSHRPAAKRCRMSAPRCKSPGAPGVDAPCPAQARDPSNAAARASATRSTGPDIELRHRCRASRQHPSSAAKIRRNSQTWPNRVCVSTVTRTPCDNTASSGSPLILDAVAQSQAAPETSASPRPAQASQANLRRRDAAAAGSVAARRKAGPATRQRKANSPPSAIADA